MKLAPEHSEGDNSCRAMGHWSDKYERLKRKVDTLHTECENSYFRYKCDKNDFVTSVDFVCVELIYVNVILGFKIFWKINFFSRLDLR